MIGSDRMMMVMMGWWWDDYDNDADDNEDDADDDADDNDDNEDLAKLSWTESAEKFSEKDTLSFEQVLTNLIFQQGLSPPYFLSS